MRVQISNVRLVQLGAGNVGDTCDTEPVDGVITANISCEESDTEASDTSPTTFTLSSKIFERFDIITIKVPFVDGILDAVRWGF